MPVLRPSSALPMSCLLAMAALGGAWPASAADPVHYRSDTTVSLDLPFSDAVRIGDLLFVSGQIGNLPGTTELAGGGIEGQARQTLDNIRDILAASGSSLERVVKCTVFLADIDDWPAFNGVYREYFRGDALPARSALAASGLALNALVEVECIAAAGAPPGAPAPESGPP